MSWTSSQSRIVAWNAWKLYFTWYTAYFYVHIPSHPLSLSLFFCRSTNKKIFFTSIYCTWKLSSQWGFDYQYLLYIYSLSLYIYIKYKYHYTTKWLYIAHTVKQNYWLHHLLLLSLDFFHESFICQFTFLRLFLFFFKEKSYFSSFFNPG